jgi:hypothetical protein
VEQIGLWQLHRIDPRVPRDEQFGAVRQLLDDGIIRDAGLSEVAVTDIEAARRVFPVATVQNRYNLVDRSSEDVLAYCAANNIGFIPWFPLAAGELTRPGVLSIASQVRTVLRQGKSRSHGCCSGALSSCRSPVRSGLPIWKKTWRLQICRSRMKKSPSSTPRPECSPRSGSMW